MERVKPENGSSNPYNEKLKPILETAAKLIAEKGFDRASIRNLAQALNVSLATIYYYFKGKEEILFLIQDSALDNLLLSLRDRLSTSQDPLVKLYAFIHNHLTFALNYPNEHRVCTTEIDRLSGEFHQRVAEKRRLYFQMVSSIYAEVQEKYDLSSDDTRAQVLCLFGALNWVPTWYQSEKDGDVNTLTLHILRVFTQGLSPAWDNRVSSLEELLMGISEQRIFRLGESLY